MSGDFDSEINLLCIGDVLSGRSIFLQKYTNSQHESGHYKVYPLIEDRKNLVYLHEVEEKYGMDAYFSYSFDAVLYFLNINDFHNPQFPIIDQLAQISKLNGTNIYKIPLKIVVLSTKDETFASISPPEKNNLINQLQGLVSQEMIIFVEEDELYRKNLKQFYQKIIRGVAPGISESLYVNWQINGFQGLFPFETLALNVKRIKDTLKRQWIKFNYSAKQLWKKQYQKRV